MRAVTDSRETVAEFRVKGRWHRLILPHGRGSFLMDRLVPDEYRRWIQRWEPFAVGLYRGAAVTASTCYMGRAVPPRVLRAIAEALRFVQEGPKSAARIYNA